jgi:hypothetical protein
VEEALLIYLDGRLIKHAALDNARSMDKDIVGSMFMAIQSFINESFKKKGSLEGFMYENFRVEIGMSKHLVLAVAVAGASPPELRDDMDRLLEKVEGLYGGILPEWDGNMKTFKAIDLQPLFAIKERYGLEFREAEGSVDINTDLEFQGGFVLLRVRIANGRSGPLTDGTMTLKYDRSVVRLVKVEPKDCRLDGNRIHIGTIPARTEKALAVHLDPMSCSESFISAVFNYIDQDGKRRVERLKERPVDIACPLFYPIDGVNIAILRRLLKSSEHREYKSFECPKAYTLARKALGSHGLKFVRELTQDKTKEAWYYGKTRSRGEEVAVQVHGTEKECTVMAASNNRKFAAGLLAELSEELKQDGACSLVAHYQHKSLMETEIGK